MKVELHLQAPSLLVLLECLNVGGNEEVWRGRLMDKVECVGSELKLTKCVMVIICLFEVFNMVLYCSRHV